MLKSFSLHWSWTEIMRGPWLALLAGAALSTGMGGGLQAQASHSSPTESQAAPLTLTGPLRITASTRITPGTYRVPVPAGTAAIEIDADNVTLDLTKVTLTGSLERTRGVAVASDSREYGPPWEREGIGVHSAGHSHITIRGGAIHGYRFGIFVQGGDDITVSGVDVGGNRTQRLLSTDTHRDDRDWVDIFHLDAWESYGAGLYLKDVQGAWIESVEAHDAQNGVMLANTTHATLSHSDLSHNSGWGIALFHSSWNDLLDNHADWDVRCEGKTYSAGCDSAGVLLMDGSNSNRIIGNSFTHSGDGYFVSQPETGATSDDNYVAFNDGSYSPHNAFESTFTSRDQFYHNIADHSDYGFWMGFSRDTSVIDNHVEGSKHDGIAIEHGSGNILARNQILHSGGAGIRLFRRQPRPEPSAHYAILENTVAGNTLGLLLNQTYDAIITGNDFADNGVGVKVEKTSARIVFHANRFSPVGAPTVEVEDRTPREP
jgi:parallel beta-helix repeat protein